MDICNFNWDIISKFVPSLITAGTALFIFSRWKNQKGSEVIANEANKAFKILSEVEILSASTLKHFRDGNIETLKKSFIGYQENYEIINNSISLILYVVKDEKLEFNYSNFNNTYENFTKVMSNELEDYHDQTGIDVLTKNIDDILFTKLIYINELKLILSEYALYKKKYKSA